MSIIIQEKRSKEVRCSECGKFLWTSTKDSLGALAVEAPKEVVVKNACLFSSKYSWLFFCSKECTKEFYTKNVGRNSEVTAVLEDMKKNIPEASREIADKMDSLIKKLKSKK